MLFLSAGKARSSMAQSIYLNYDVVVLFEGNAYTPAAKPCAPGVRDTLIDPPRFGCARSVKQ